MKTRTKIPGCFVLLAFIAITEYAHSADISFGIDGPAAAFTPRCEDSDHVCAVWREFRRMRPYPYQSFASKLVGDGTLILVISEPAPVIGKSELQHLIQRTFGPDLISQRTLRWNIGIDGWVEDIVLQVRYGSAGPASDKANPDNVLDNGLLRDRVALLHVALYGTSYGGDVEVIGDTQAHDLKSAAPNLSVSAKEIQDWVMDARLLWRPIDPWRHAEKRPWPALASQHAAGAYVSDDGTLAMLVFPAKSIEEAKTDPRALDFLRTDFRKFAVASDAILGGFWSPGGQVAVVARARIKPLRTLPPLRFETVALLAAQSSNELQQSYERTNVLAGKLQSGQYRLKDWAPILLSGALIDTEFGALLNITDQMLKSWSEAGFTEYVYFDYPYKPKTFAFKDAPLSKIVFEQSGSQTVLFNWNTSGSAAIAKLPRMAILATRQSGALPVTYGSDRVPGQDVQTGHLLAYEKRAYDYFARLGDANLARVVQYTLVYQLFRALAAEHDSSGPAHPHPEQTPTKRAASTALLVREAKKVLDSIETGSIEKEFLPANNPFKEEIASTVKRIAVAISEFKGKFPGIDNARLAALLADPRTEARPPAELLAAYADLLARRNQEIDTLNRELKEHDERQEQANREVTKWFTTHPGNFSRNMTREQFLGALPLSLRVKLERLRASAEELKRRRDELQRKPEVVLALERHRATVMASHRLAEEVRQLFTYTDDLDAIRVAFIEANAAEPAGWIKTPSVVLSWNRNNFLAEGGHNLNSRALRFEPSSNVKGIQLVSTEHGPVLRYEPARADAIAAKATEIAREVEHGRITDVKKLEAMLGAVPRTRSRVAALEIPAEGPVAAQRGRAGAAEAWSSKLGARIYSEKKPYVEDLRAIAEGNDCCVFVAKDANQVAYIAEKNPSPPPGTTIIEARDTPSLTSYFAAKVDKGGKPFVFFDMPHSQVEALTRGGLVEYAPLLDSMSAGDGASGRTTIAHRDLGGRPANLSVQASPSTGSARSLVSRLLRKQPPRVWREATVSLLPAEGAKTILKNAGWDVSQHGNPHMIMVSLGRGGMGAKPPGVGVIAGFPEAQLAAGAKGLLDAHRGAVESAAANGSTVAQYMMTLRSNLHALSDLQLKRLDFVVQEGETGTWLSRDESLHAFTRGL